MQTIFVVSWAVLFLVSYVVTVTVRVVLESAASFVWLLCTLLWERTSESISPNYPLHRQVYTLRSCGNFLNSSGWIYAYAHTHTHCIVTTHSSRLHTFGHTNCRQSFWISTSSVTMSQLPRLRRAQPVQTDLTQLLCQIVNLWYYAFPPLSLSTCL